MLLLLGAASLAVGHAFAEAPVAFPDAKPDDRRNGELRNLNSYFPFKAVDNVEAWKTRQAEIQRRILVSQGLWPMPTKAPLNAVIHGRVEREDYVVDRVYFESIPGHFVTGSLYRPKGEQKGRLPAILSPHGHWRDGRFYDAGEATIKNEIEIGAEKFERGGRHVIQARAVQLARMGCLVFVYDMTGNADSIQMGHRPDRWKHLDTKTDWGFMSVQAELRLQNMMGLQTWNSIRAIDFLLELDETDPDRIGVTGASGGGTQSMIIGAIDTRIAAAMPCVMVSTSMQGGCTCENAPLMRIDQGNIDIAAATAPRPLGLTAADDWTIELETKGYPDLLALYQMLGHRDRLTAVFETRFKHNYNLVNRTAMYGFFNRHFDLGYSEPIQERDYIPLSRQEATVWTDDHPAPSGKKVGDPHEIKTLRIASKDSDQRIAALVPQTADQLKTYRDVIGGAWETILGRRVDQVGDVQFQQRSQEQQGGATIRVGHLNHSDQGEQNPVVIVDPIIAGESTGTVIWVTNTGKASLFEGAQLAEPVRRLVHSGKSVIAADLFGQGEFLADQQPIDAQPMWYQRGGDQGWHRFAGYTYGYNHPLFVKRVHDILSLVKFANTNRKGPVDLVGSGSMAGPLVIAARSQSADKVHRTWADVGQFRFADLTRHDDPMFVPGAVKYLDLDGLVSLCAPGSVTLCGGEESDLAKTVYAAAAMSNQLNFDQESDAATALVDALAD